MIYFHAADNGGYVWVKVGDSGNWKQPTLKGGATVTCTYGSFVRQCNRVYRDLVRNYLEV